MGTVTLQKKQNHPDADDYVEGAIRNPVNPRHFMVIKPVGRAVNIWRDGRLPASTNRGIRVIELSRKAYDPVIYVPTEDFCVQVDPVERTTHCPIKGDATCFSLSDEEIGWSYPLPFDFAAELADHRAFWASRVLVEGGCQMNRLPAGRGANDVQIRSVSG